MINRYSRQIMSDIWSDQSKYSIWLEIELFAHEAMEAQGMIEDGLTKKIRKKIKNTQLVKMLSDNLMILFLLVNNI